MNNDFISCFITAAKSVMESFGMAVNGGDSVLKSSPFKADSILIVIGLTGELHGQAIISMEKETACYIASLMMGGATAELNEVSKSAVAELSNMIIGNAVTLLSKENIMLDITPPSVLTGENMSVSTTSLSICVPFNMDGGRVLEFSISAKELSNY